MVPRLFVWAKSPVIVESENLIRKLHRVTPLRHVLYFFTLVNLVNQFRRVVDQPHGRFARHTGTAQPVDVGNAQAVEAQMRFFNFDEKLLPPARRLEWKFQREFLLGFAEAFKQGTQRGRHRNGKRPIFTALWRRKRDFIFFEIKTANRPSNDVFYSWQTSRAAACLDNIIPANSLELAQGQR